MNTKFIGIKEFRQNITAYAKKARAGKTRFVVMSHKKPLFEVIPFDNDVELDSVYEAIARAKEDVAKGRVYTHDEILKMLS